MECISDDDHGAQWSFLGLLHGLRQHVANIHVAATTAFGPIHDDRHVVGVGDPTRRDPAAAHPGGVIRAIECKFHLQAAAGRRIEHLALKYLGALPAGTVPMVGNREDDARGARYGLLAVSAKHAP